MKEQIKYSIGGVALAVICIFLFNYQNDKIVMPTVGADGKISGNYAIESIMVLGKPYTCNFDKSDGSSKISGVIHTDGGKIYGEFKIKTDLIKNEFNSFLLIKDNMAYTWTSLQNIGYKSSIAKSASKNASPQEQAQIVGTRDKMQYNCELWLNADNSLFETPTSITFSELKK
jgi:hypothetical protein